MTARIRLWTLGTLPVVVAVGLALKFYRGPAHVWVNHWGPASVAYEVFWMLLFFLVLPEKSRIGPIAGVVCLLTCGVEFLQLWQPPWLQAIRATLPGKFVLGTSFSWWDLPAYPCGCLLGVGLLHLIVRVSSPSAKPPPTKENP